MAERTHSPHFMPAELSAFAEDDRVAQFSRDLRIKRALEQANVVRDQLAPEIVQEYKRLIETCYVMKGTLFNAAKRLERKHRAAQFTFALSGIYGFLVPLFALQFEPFLTALVTNIVSFTAATAGAVSFVVAMIYQQQNLGRKSGEFHDAGLKMNQLRRRLRATPLTSADQIAKANHQYDDIFVTCSNHDEIDYEYGKLGSRPKDNKDGRADFWIKNRRRLDIRFFLQTYLWIVMVWVIPPMIGLSIWLTLSGDISTAAQIAR